jgi:hypothetical protein
MSQTVEGVFEVIECEDGKLVVRHLETTHDYELDLPTESTKKFFELLPLGTHFLGKMEIENVHFC